VGLSLPLLSMLNTSQLDSAAKMERVELYGRRLFS